MSETGNNTLKLERLPMHDRPRLGGILVAVCIAAGWADKAEFFRSYLVAFLFWLGITLGCLALLMVQHLTGGNWALVIRRILEAGSRTLPLMAVAALPLLAGMKTLYIWSQPGQTDPVILCQALVSESAIFCGANGLLFPVLVSARVSAEQMVPDRGCGGGGIVAVDAHGRVERHRTGDVRIYRHVRFDRLGDVHRAALVFDNLWDAVHGGPGAGGHGVCHHMLIWLSDREPLSRIVTPSHFRTWAAFC